MLSLLRLFYSFFPSSSLVVSLHLPSLSGRIHRTCTHLHPSWRFSFLCRPPSFHPSGSLSSSSFFSLLEEWCCCVLACHSSWAFPHLFTTTLDKGAGVSLSRLPSTMCVHRSVCKCVFVCVCVSWCAQWNIQLPPTIVAKIGKHAFLR